MLCVIVALTRRQIIASRLLLLPPSLRPAEVVDKKVESRQEQASLLRLSSVVFAKYDKTAPYFKFLT